VTQVIYGSDMVPWCHQLSSLKTPKKTVVSDSYWLIVQKKHKMYAFSAFG